MGKNWKYRKFVILLLFNNSVIKNIHFFFLISVYLSISIYIDIYIYIYLYIYIYVYNYYYLHITWLNIYIYIYIIYVYHLYIICIIYIFIHILYINLFHRKIILKYTLIHYKYFAFVYKSLVKYMLYWCINSYYCLADICIYIYI